MLKGGLRAFCIEDPIELTRQTWYNRFQGKDIVEFFVEGSGIYKLVNIDMSDGELYFEKTVTPAYSKKQMFINMDFSDHFKNGLDQHIKDKFSNKISNGTISDFSKGKGAIKLDDEIFKEIRASLFFIADITPIASKSIIAKKEKWIANSNVMLELGFALGVKPKERIIITYDEKYSKDLQFPFDLQSYLNCPYNSETEDYKELISEIEALIHRYGL